MQELGVPLNAHRWFVDENISISQQVDEWWASWGQVFILIGVLYLPLVFGLQFIWRKIPAVNLKLWRIVHNVAFCVFSTIGAVELFPTMYNTIILASGFKETVCGGYYISRPESFWLIVFGTSKAFELIESFYFIVEKKPIPFIHWYHHIMTYIFTINSLYLKDTSILYYAWMNYTVHAIMYFYYSLASLTNSRPAWAPIVTVLQILQMFVGTAVVFTVYFCSPPHE